MKPTFRRVLDPAIGMDLAIKLLETEYSELMADGVCRGDIMGTVRSLELSDRTEQVIGMILENLPPGKSRVGKQANSG